MQICWAVILLWASTVVYPQSPPTSCPADRPVDDIIKEQSKRHRNSNPLPQIAPVTTPPTFPEPPQIKLPTTNNNTASSEPNDSTPVATCEDSTKMAREAAHDVEVGDSYFGQKKYSGALLRYKDAAEKKPGDLAIHVRLGRALEKLGQVSQAAQEYQAAQKLSGPEKWSEEAKSALRHLQHVPGS